MSSAADGFSQADFSEFFESIFGGGGGGAQGFGARAHGARGGQQRRPAARDGEDRTLALEITLEEAFAGGSRQVEISGASGRRTLNVRIPAGIEAGRKIRLAGQGEAGAHGGADGDIYLEIAYAPHPRYRADRTFRVATGTAATSRTHSASARHDSVGFAASAAGSGYTSNGW